MPYQFNVDIPDGDNAREPDGVRAQGISARGGSFREQVQRVPSGQDLRSRADIDIPDTA